MSMDPIGSSEKPITISDRLFIDLRRAILTGELAAGKKISEPELSNQYGVSRGSLREAIGKLENCNLVTRRPNIGARIVDFSIAQLMEIYQVREAMEGMAARLAAYNLTETELLHLRRLLETQQRALEQKDEQAYGCHYDQDVDFDFHFYIIQGSGNKRLINMLCEDLYELVRFYRFRLNPSFQPEALQEHVLIVQSLERRDGEMAELLMRHHIRASRDRARERLESEGYKATTH